MEVCDLVLLLLVYMLGCWMQWNRDKLRSHGTIHKCVYVPLCACDNY